MPPKRNNKKKQRKPSEQPIRKPIASNESVLSLKNIPVENRKQIIKQSQMIKNYEMKLREAIKVVDGYSKDLESFQNMCKRNSKNCIKEYHNIDVQHMQIFLHNIKVALLESLHYVYDTEAVESKYLPFSCSDTASMVKNFYLLKTAFDTTRVALACNWPNEYKEKFEKVIGHSVPDTTNIFPKHCDPPAHGLMLSTERPTKIFLILQELHKIDPDNSSLNTYYNNMKQFLKYLDHTFEMPEDEVDRYIDNFGTYCHMTDGDHSAFGLDIF